MKLNFLKSSSMYKKTLIHNTNTNLVYLIKYRENYLYFKSL